MRNRYTTYWRPVTVYQSFTNITMLAIVRYINGRCFALVHLLAEISLSSHARVYDKMTCEKWPRSPRIITITKARKAHWLRVVL